MKYLKFIILFIWTFPVPLMSIFNRQQKAGTFKASEGKEISVWVYRWWGGTRNFATAAWPSIYVPRVQSIMKDELMHHEHRHIQQQLLVGGILFLLTYGLSFLVLLPFKKFKWYDAYLAIPWEVDARKYANKKINS